jgi:transposase
LVAAVCQDLKIAERIDSRLPPDSRRKMSAGIAAVAMIINGLGFTNRTLYLAHRFFESKPVERLLGENFKARDITDDALGHALDDIAEYGSSNLFAEVAFGIAIENDLLGLTNHIDTTTMLARISHTFSDSSHALHDDLAVQMGEAVLLEHCPHPSEQQSQSAERRSVQKKCEKCGLVHGEYDIEDDPQTIEVTHGFSKAHRPDLKQVILSLVPHSADPKPQNRFFQRHLQAR